MFDEMRRSVHAYLYERVASPFYADFFFSWGVVNWRIPYLLFFGDLGDVPVGQTKLAVIEGLINWWDGLVWPLVGVVVVVGVVPLMAAGALWVHLFYRRWQVSLKQKIEGGQLLSVADSVRVRGEVGRVEEEFVRQLQAKDEKIAEKEEEVKNLKVDVEQGLAEISQLKGEVGELRGKMGGCDAVGEKSGAGGAVVSVDELVEELVVEIREKTPVGEFVDLFNRIRFGVVPASVSKVIEKEVVDYLSSRGLFVFRRDANGRGRVSYDAVKNEDIRITDRGEEVLGEAGRLNMTV